MTNMFLNRVSAERRALAVVNAESTHADQLTGLSRAAILQWRAKVGIERTSTIHPILFRVAELCQRLSDRSHETFLPLEASQSEDIDAHIQRLQQEITKWL